MLSLLRTLSKIVILGGSGFIGRHLRAGFEEDGEDVVVLTREPTTQKGFVQLDSVKGKDKGALFEGADTIINLAGESVNQRWTERTKRAILESRLKSTRMVAEAISEMKVKPRCWVNFSAAGYYGDRGNTLLTETASVGSGFLAEVCKKWEAEAVKGCPSEVKLSLIRAGLVLGNGGGAWPRMFNLSRRGLLGTVGAGTQYLPWIHVDDLTWAVMWVVDEGLTGPINVCAPNSIPNREFTKAIEGVFHRLIALPTPRFALNLAERFGYPVSLLTSSERLVPQALLESKFTFQFPTLVDALQRLKPPAKVR